LKRRELERVEASYSDHVQETELCDAAADAGEETLKIPGALQRWVLRIASLGSTKRKEISSIQKILQLDCCE